MLRTRVLTALALGGAVLLAIFLAPPWMWTLLVAVVVWLALGEWGLLTGASSTGSFVFRALVFAGILAFDLLLPQDLRDQVAWLGYAAAIAFWFVAAPLMLVRFSAPRPGLLAYVTGVAVFLPAAIALIELRLAGHAPWALIAAIFAVNLADIAAYFSGRRFGRRKLAPVISPGKSWEGLYGAGMAVVLFAIALWATIPALGQAMHVTLLLGFALLYVAASVVGDLFESVLKRRAGVKDSGTVLPGHGGILDRIDSLLPTLPLAAAMMAAFA